MFKLPRSIRIIESLSSSCLSQIFFFVDDFSFFVCFHLIRESSHSKVLKDWILYFASHIYDQVVITIRNIFGSRPIFSSRRAVDFRNYICTRHIERNISIYSDILNRFYG